LKILQICHKMPNPPSDGGAQAIHNTTLGLLKNHIHVDVLSINPSRNYIDISTLPDAYLRSTNFEAVYVDTRIKPFNLLLNFFKKDSYFIERFQSEAFARKITEILSLKKFDIIQLEHLYLFIYFDLIRKHSNAKIVLRPQNIEYVIWERYLHNTKNSLKRLFIRTATRRLKKYEQSVSAKADGIIAITADDAEIFKSFEGQTSITDIPMGFHYEHHEHFDYNEQYINFPVFYHLGSMDWLPNEEALKWFFGEIYDLVISKVPDIKIHIAGKNMQKFFFKKGSKNLLVEGEIKNPIEFQKNKAIMIVPLLSGSGIRAKIVEGLALGKTIITTTIGAQGIKYNSGKNILIADSPIDFANQIIKCYSSKELCIEIGKNAKKLAEEEYHYVTVAKKIIKFYKSII
jgi:polysaccharide biosynthesis protein PslH